MVLTTREWSDLYADAATVLTTTGQIQRPTSTTDQMGGRSRTFATVATSACRVSPVNASSTEKMLPGGALVRDTADLKVTFPAGTDVRLRDQIVVAGETFSVEGVRAPKSLEVERVAFVKRAAA